MQTRCFCPCDSAATVVIVDEVMARRFWPGERRYELIEVKGPGDKLQDNQVRWLEYCVAHGMPVSVCHVSWQEDAP